MGEAWQMDPVAPSAPWANDPVAPATSDLPNQAAASAPRSGPTGSLWGDVKNRASDVALNLGAGMVSLPNLAAQGVDWGAGLLGYKPGAEEALSSVPMPGTDGKGPMFPNFQQAKDVMSAAYGMPQYVPETYAGRLGQAGLTAMAGGGIGGLAGGLRAGAAATIPAFAGGVTGQTAADLLPEHPFIAGALGYAAGNRGAANLANSASRGIGLLSGSPVNETYQAYQRQGIPTTLSGDASGNPSLQFIQAAAKKMPGAEGLVAEASDAALNSWRDRLNSVASNLGKAETAQEAGASLQNGARDWLTRWKADTSQKWNAFRDLVPESAPVPVTNFRNSLNGVLQDFGGAENLARVMQPGKAREMLEALARDAGDSGALPWKSIQSIRTRVGEMLDSPQIVGDMNQGALKRIYAGLSQDMGAAAEAVSPQASRAFHTASAATAAGHDLLDNHIAPIINAASPEQAAQYALAQARNGGTRTGALTFNLPEARGDLASYVLRKAAGDTAESPGAFATYFSGTRQRGGLLSPEARQTLFPDPTTQQNIADLAKVGNAMKATEQYVNHSNSAVHVNRLMGRIMAAKELGEIGHEMAGHTGKAVGFGAGLLAPEAMGKTMSVLALNPALARYFATEPFLPVNRATGLLPRLGMMSGNPTSAPAISANSQ